MKKSGVLVSHAIAGLLAANTALAENLDECLLNAVQSATGGIL